MSTLKVTDIQSYGTGFNDVVSFQNASGTENGKMCRAYVQFDGGTGTPGQPDVTISSSFNVSSVTDNNTGDYTITFTNSMVDANYIYTFAPAIGAYVFNVANNAQTGTCPVKCFVTTSAAAQDSGICSAAFFR